MATRQVLTDLDFVSVSKIQNLPNPTSAQEAATKAYVDSAVEGLAWKDSVRAASAGANINLASPGATLDGVTLATNDRFLAKDQSTPSQNGIYIWNGAATPATRAADASTFAELEQAVVVVEEGTTNAGTTWRQTQVNGTIDSSTVTFTAFGTAAGAATETTAGVIEIATQSETDTGTDDARAVTPLKLATYSGRAKRAAATIGDGAQTTYTVTHNFNTRDVIVQVYRNSGNYDEVMPEVRRNNVNSVDIIFSSAPASNAYRVVVLA